MTLILSGTNGVSDIDGDASTPAIRGTDANTGIFFGADIIGFSEGGTECARFNSSGNLQTIGTISVGNATPTTSGAGITFPATQSASSDANTLDDYEEGTWTPTVTFGGASAGQNYNVRVGSYTKVGRSVTAHCYVYFANKGSSTGNAYIEGLPFANQSGAGNNGGGAIYGYAFMASLGNPLPGIEPGDSKIALRTGDATGDAFMTQANFNPGLLVLVVNYFV